MMKVITLVENVKGNQILNAMNAIKSYLQSANADTFNDKENNIEKAKRRLNIIKRFNLFNYKITQAVNKSDQPEKLKLKINDFEDITEVDFTNAVEAQRNNEIEALTAIKQEIMEPSLSLMISEGKIMSFINPASISQEATNYSDVVEKLVDRTIDYLELNRSHEGIMIDAANKLYKSIVLRNNNPSDIKITVALNKLYTALYNKIVEYSS